VNRIGASVSRRQRRCRRWAAHINEVDCGQVRRRRSSGSAIRRGQRSHAGSQGMPARSLTMKSSGGGSAARAASTAHHIPARPPKSLGAARRPRKIYGRWPGQSEDASRARSQSAVAPGHRKLRLCALPAGDAIVYKKACSTKTSLKLKNKPYPGIYRTYQLSN
jgi:hypothetical protein